MKKLVLIPQDIAEAGKRLLVDRGYEVQVGSGADARTVIAEGADAEAVILRLSPFGRDIIEQLPQLRIIARHGVGYDNVDVEAATENGIWVTNTPMANAESVAETALTLLLSLAKRIVDDSNHMRADDFFYKNSHKGMDVDGKTLGVVGYGKIGRALAAKASGLGLRILVHDPYLSEVPIGTLVDRDTLLRESDFVSLHLPADEATNGSFDADTFAAMKPTSYLLNLARGSIVDEPALIAALQEHVIAGAAIDVYSTEPLPPGHPLFALDNVLLTPHIASNTVETMNRMALHAAEEVDRVLSGGTPKWAVNAPTSRQEEAGR